MDKKKLDNLQEFLDFVQQDFDKVDQLKKESFAHRGMSYGLIFPTSKIEGEHWSLDEEIWRHLVLVCKDALNIFRYIFETSTKGGFITYNMPAMFFAGHKPSIGKQHGYINVYTHTPFSSPLSSGGYEMIPRWDGQEEELIVKTICNPRIVFDQVEDVCTNRLKTCPECETIFVQKTAREKKYCSDFCKNKHHLKLKKA